MIDLGRVGDTEIRKKKQFIKERKGRRDASGESEGWKERTGSRKDVKGKEEKKRW